MNPSHTCQIFKVLLSINQALSSLNFRRFKKVHLVSPLTEKIGLRVLSTNLFDVNLSSRRCRLKKIAANWCRGGAGHRLTLA